MNFHAKLFRLQRPNTFIRETFENFIDWHVKFATIFRLFFLHFTNIIMIYLSYLVTSKRFVYNTHNLNIYRARLRLLLSVKETREYKVKSISREQRGMGRNWPKQNAASRTVTKTVRMTVRKAVGQKSTGPTPIPAPLTRSSDGH